MLSEIASCLLRLPNPSLLQLTVIASALSARTDQGKIAIATSQGYFMELLCRYWKIRKPFKRNDGEADFGSTANAIEFRN
jgi:hypothetical protein